jgi:hypothetical protein
VKPEAYVRRNVLWLAGAVFLYWASSSQAAIVTFSPAAETVNANQVFTVDIVASDFDMIVDGGGLDLSFNPGMLRVLDLDYADIWDLTLPVTIDNAAGMVSNIRFGSFASIQDDFPIATVTMQALGQGETTLDLAVQPMFPFGHNGDEITVTPLSGSIHVVPEPALGVLVLGGLLGVFFARRYRAHFAQSVPT